MYVVGTNEDRLVSCATSNIPATPTVQPRLAASGTQLSDCRMFSELSR